MTDYNSCNANVSFSRVLDLWLSANEVRIKRATHDKYNYLINTHILPELGNFSVSELSATQINGFLSKKLRNGGLEDNSPLSPSYVSTMSMIINGAIKYAVNENLCSAMKNPIFKPTLYKKQISILNNSDYKKLVSYLSDNLNSTKTGVLLALYTGLRIGEICALKWNNVDLKSMILHIKSTVSRVNIEGKTKFILEAPKTKSSVRDIPIPTKLGNILKSLYKVRKSDYVVSDKVGFVIPRTLEYRFHRITNLLGIEEISFHALRHTFATNCLSNGMDVKSLSEILGHANASTTLQIYVHPSMEVKRKQINKAI